MSLLKYGAHRTCVLFVPGEQQRFIWHCEDALLHAVPQCLWCCRNFLARARVDCQQATAKQTISPSKAQASRGVPWCGEDSEHFVSELQGFIVCARMRASAPRALHQRSAQTRQHFKFLGPQQIVLVRSQHPAQPQFALGQHGRENRQVTTSRVDQHRLASVQIGQKVGQLTTGYVMQDAEVHLSPPTAYRPPTARQPDRTNRKKAPSREVPEAQSPRRAPSRHSSPKTSPVPSPGWLLHRREGMPKGRSCHPA